MLRKTLIALLLASPAAPDMQKMTCSLCSITVQKALGKVPGVAGAKVDYDKKTATVKFDPEKANLAALVRATTDAGFLAKLHGAAKP